MKREDRVVVGETVKGQFDKFVRSVIVKNIRMLEDPAYVAARLTRLPTSTHKGRIYIKQVSKCNLLLCKPFDMSSLISCSNHCHQLYVISSTVSVSCLFPRCPLHISNGRGTPGVRETLMNSGGDLDLLRIQDGWEAMPVWCPGFSWPCAFWWSG